MTLETRDCAILFASCYRVWYPSLVSEYAVPEIRLQFGVNLYHRVACLVTPYLADEVKLEARS